MHDSPSTPEQQQTADAGSAADSPSKAENHRAGDLLTADIPPGVPIFQPTTGLRNPHAQTVYGALRPARPNMQGTLRHQLAFADGDISIVHEDRPAGWTRGDRVVLLMHGMAGCHQSGYMVRTAAKLLNEGVRVFRMDHRGCGAGRTLARNPYHAGRTRDLEAALRMLERLCPGSSIAVAGFSLSGNLLLKYLGENAQALPLSLSRAVCVCPPIDLLNCVEKLTETRMGQRYDWYFARQLVGQIVDTPLWRDDVPLAEVRRPPRRIIEFDELYTAPASGFDSAQHYYSVASSAAHIPNIQIPTSVLVAEDDPLVAAEPWSSIPLPASVELCRTKHGGHLGFIGRRGVDPDNRWMDWRVMDWLLQ